MKETLSLPAGHEGAVWRSTGQIRYPKHRHDELEVNLVRRGTGRYLLDNAVYELKPGSLVWLFPAQNHVLLDRSADFDLWVLVFQPRLLRRLCHSGAARFLLNANPAGHHCRQLATAQARRLDALFRELLDATAPTLLNAGLGYALLSAWTAFAMPGTWLLTGTDVHPAVEKAAQLLRHETRTVPAAELARRCGLSYSRLGALFKQQTGVALVDFRNRQRLDRFLALYGAGHDRKMLEAALAAGFGSYPQFHRVFKQWMGCSPQNYRRQQAGNQP